MLNFLKSKTAKAAVGLLAIAMFVMLGGIKSASATITHTLKYHSTYKTEVMELQNGLNSMGFANPALVADGSFGAKTLAAVKAYQANKGLVADGIFGAMSRAAWTGTPTGGVQGNCPTGYVMVTPVAPLFASCAPSSGQVTTGPVSVMLAIDNPASGYVTANQAGANLLKLTFTGTGTVTNVQLKKMGVAADGTYNNIYLYDGNMRVTDGGSISNNGLVTFANPTGLFTVNGSKTITVKADICGGASCSSPTSGEVIGLGLNSYTISGTATPIMSTIMGNQMSVVSASGLSSVTLGGSMLPSAGSIDPQNDFVVWQNTVTIANRDAKLVSLALREIGSIGYQDLTNFRLMIDGQTVATTASIDMNGYVTLAPVTPANLMQGSRTLKVMADVVGGSYRNFQFQLRNKVDFNVTDSQSGYGISVAGTIPANAGQQIINQGNITAQKATTSPSGDVIYNGTDVVLARYTLRTFGEAVKIDSIKVSSTQSSGTAGLRSGRLLIDGQQVGSTATLAEDSAGTPYTIYNTNYTLAAGSTATLEVRADLYDTTGGALAAATTIVTNLVTGSSNAQGVSSGQVFNFPASSIASNTVTVRSGSVTLAKNSNYTNQTTVAPQTNYKIGSWTVTGGSVEDVNLDTFSVSTAYTDAFADADLNNVTLKVDGVQVGTVKSTVTSPFSFSGSVLLPKNTSKVIDLYADVLTSATNGSGAADTIIPTLTVTGTTTPSGSSVAPSAVGGQTITAGTGSFTTSTDASAPLSRIVAGSQNDVAVGAFKFATTNDTYTVKEITVKFSGVRNPEQVISAVKLKDSTNAIIGSAQALSGTSVTFSGLSWAIPANTNNKYFTVFADLAAIGTANATSGTEIEATLDSVKYTDSSGVETTDGTDRVDSTKVYYAYKATPTITNVNLPTTVLAAGTQTIAKFNISANGGNPVTWKKIILTTTPTGSVTVASPILVDENGTTIPTTTNTVAASTGGAVTFVLTNEEEISTSKTYAVKITIGGTVASGDSVSTNIGTGVTTFAAPNTYAVVAATASSFAWSDKADVSHSLTTLDWNNNFLVKNLPTDSQTLTK